MMIPIVRIMIMIIITKLIIMIITIITTITTTKKSVLVWPLPCRKYTPPIGAEFLIGIVLQLVIEALKPPHHDKVRTLRWKKGVCTTAFR